MAFVLFLLVNVVLIIRPTEIVSGLENLPIYNVVILMALVAAAGRIVEQLKSGALAARPITACVVGFLVAIVLSQLARGSIDGAVGSGTMFVKVVLYYLLVVANLRTPRHLRLFLVVVCVLMAAQVGLALLQYFEYIDVEALRPHRDTIFDPETGSTTKGTPRLCGAGIFHDPNDLCVFLVIGAVLSVCVLRDPMLGPARFLAVVPLVVSLGSIPLTASRGGMIALLSALVVGLVQRFGARGFLVLGALVPVALVALGGRMTKFDVDDPSDTSQQRMRSWSDGLVAVRSRPVFGIGQGMYEDVAGLCAHNSYIEGYVETGLLGGTLFAGALAYAAWALIRVGRRLPPDRSPGIAGFNPYLLAIIVGLMAGMLSLSRNYTPPTYLVLGLVTAYLRLVAPKAPRAVPPLTTALAVRWAGWSVLFFVALSIGTGLLVRR